MKQILVPVDFSECSQHALTHALELASSLGASVEVLHVWQLPVLASTGEVMIAIPDQPYETAAAWMEREASQKLDELISQLETRDVRVTKRLDSGRAEERILARAAHGAFDMIVMGTHGRGGLSHLLIGSVAERVVRLANCPVFTVKTPSTSPAT